MVMLIASAWLVCACAAHADSVFKSGGQSMFADRKAHGVGDVITVIITESTTAQQATATSVQNQAANTATGGSGLFGILKVIPKASLGGSVSQSGQGSTSRSSSLTTTITCKVTGVTAGGLLQITGERVFKVNVDTQTIRFSGVCRVDDIAIDNTIASSSVADSKVDVIGRGPLDHHARPGILTSLFQYLIGG